MSTSAVEFHEPSNSQISRRMDWDYFVPRIGDEIEHIAALQRQVLAPKWPRTRR